MTLAIVQEPAASGAEGIDLEAWRAWLGTAVEAGWRSGEWDGQALLFTGDVDNPRTRPIPARPWPVPRWCTPTASAPDAPSA